MGKFVAPVYWQDSFHCPRCGVLAHQRWDSLRDNFGVDDEPSRDEMCAAYCFACSNYSIWENQKLVFPQKGNAPLAVDEMPLEVKSFYEEAADIAGRSPRAASGLLRLALQLLISTLGKKGKDLNADIAALVKEGMPVHIQQALDIVRVIGNNAVHPGEIQLDDNPEIAGSLFGVMNLIVETMVTQPKRLEELYESLPKGAREAIEKRDE